MLHWRDEVLTHIHWKSVVISPPISVILANLNRQGKTVLVILSLGKIFLASAITLFFQLSLKLLAEELFSSRHSFLSVRMSVHACVCREQGELLWLDFLARLPAPFAQSSYMFPQDYTTCWPFQLQLNSLACWRLTPPPSQPTQRLASLHWSQWNCNKIKSMSWNKIIQPFWKYSFNNQLIWCRSDSGKQHLIDRLITTMMWHANIHFSCILVRRSGTWRISVFIFDLTYLVLNDSKPEEKKNM